MGWSIVCNNQSCKRTSYATNIDDLLSKHRNEEGWFKCAHCGSTGHIYKRFELQEKGTTWEPYLRGAISLGLEGDTYQPFVFLVSYENDGPVYNMWFSYYKDTRQQGGKLKMGSGPGGPPVLANHQLIDLLSATLKLNIIQKEDILELLEDLENDA